MMTTNKDKYMFEELMDIAKNMSQDIVGSMDSIYNHLQSHPKWPEMMSIENRASILRQDHPTVGLLQQKGLKEVFDLKEDDAEDMKRFIDSSLAINSLTSKATKINGEFQNHIKSVMSHYGEFKPGPMKKVKYIVLCITLLNNF